MGLLNQYRHGILLKVKLDNLLGNKFFIIKGMSFSKREINFQFNPSAMLKIYLRKSLK